MPEYRLTDNELAALRFFEAAFHEGEYDSDWDAIPCLKSLSPAERQKMLARLMSQYRLIEGVTMSTVKISEQGLGVLHDIDHPLPKDYWASLVRWFRSRWWSIPLMLIFVVLPLVVTWIGILRALLTWLGVIDSP